MKPTVRLPPTLEVLVVDDHPLVRQGLRAMIGTAVDDLAFVEAGSASEAMERLAEGDPDVAIVDLGLPDSSGFELVRQIREVDAVLPVLVLSMYPEDIYAERALRAGASGYVMKEEGGRVVLEALEKVLHDELWLSGQVALRIAGSATGAAPSEGSAIGDLTDRELEIWCLLGEGRTTREIAGRLGISPKTVETHCYNIRSKTDIANATELVHEATRWLHGERSTP